MLKLDYKISSKLDGLFDDRPKGQAVAILAAKYLLWAFVGAGVVAFPLIIGDFYEFSAYLIVFFAPVLICHLFTLGLSFIVRRKRPYERLPDVWHLPIRVYTPSFPSGHATIAFATATFLVWIWQPMIVIIIGLYVVATIIALARVVVGVHYVTDVIAGAFIGTVGSWLMYLEITHIFTILFN